MNFVFILDTSISMSQTFEGLSFFDSAKFAIKNFVLRRDITNSKLQIKTDKYFLMTLNESLEESLICNWNSSTEHFLYQLNSLKINCDFTNIDFAFRNAFNMVNHIRKISLEKHFLGRLFSKIQNSFIIFITDGGILSNSKKVLNDPNITLMDPNISNYIMNYENVNSIPDDKIPKLFHEIFRWDQSIYGIILNDSSFNNSSPGYDVLNKYCKLCGGKIYNATKIEHLIKTMDELNDKILQNNRVYIQFTLNSKKKMITSIEYTNNDIIQDKWPFPDEILIKKETKILPVKKSIPNYKVSQFVKFNFDINENYYDEYEIRDKRFIINLIVTSDATIDLTLQTFLDNYKENMYFEITTNINDMEIYNKPFAIIKCLFDKLLIAEMNKVEDKENTTISFFFEKLINSSNASYLAGKIKCKYDNLPFDFPEFNNIINKYKNGISHRAELLIQTDKYFKKIPFYYKLYGAIFFDKNGILSYDKDVIMKQIEKDYVSKSVINEIKILFHRDFVQRVEINKCFVLNKNEHQCIQNSSCCRKEVLYKDEKTEVIKNENNKNDEEDYQNFLSKCLNINKAIQNKNENQKNLISNQQKEINNYYQNYHEYDIELMGDYNNYIIRAYHPKDITIKDEEIQYLSRELFFGNQFRSRKESYVSNQNMYMNNIVYSEDNIFSQELSPERKEELSVTNIKRSRDDSEITMNNNNNDNSIISTNLDSLSDTDSNFDNTIPLIEEFKEFSFCDNIKENKNVNVVKLTSKFSIFKDDLKRWKFNKQIQKYTKKLINCLSGRDDLFENVNEILKKDYLFDCKERKIEFLKRLITLGNNYSVDKISLNKLQKLINSLNV